MTTLFWLSSAFVGLAACFSWMAIRLKRDGVQAVRSWRVRRECTRAAREWETEQREWRRSWGGWY